MQYTPSIEQFQGIVRDLYQRHFRDMPWRPPTIKMRQDGTLDPYAILVSEVMLQQTQVNRVIPKYEAFLRQFPTIKILAEASLAEVLAVWNGLGYNRRAKFLHAAAKQVLKEYGGVVPQNVDELAKLPGIGQNTAGAIVVYAFNQPAIFIETNIRSVFIHHFFPGQKDIPDKEILELVRLSLPSARGLIAKTTGLFDYRHWYWALMDYGGYLKSSTSNPSRRSKHHAQQSRFEGSPRQIRGQVIRILTAGKKSALELKKEINDGRLSSILAQLTQEGLIQKQRNRYQLSD